MSLSLIAAPALAFAPAAAFAVKTAPSADLNVRMETIADLKKLALEANPIVGYWDPMNLVEYDQWSQGEEATVGFLRQAEIKHGRVAMAAFVGYIVQANGIHFPWGLTGDVSYADISAAGAPPDQWDALPSASKLQILGFIGGLEIISESAYILSLSGEKHYMRGGKPGFFPKLNTWMPHPVPLEFWDPFGFTAKMSPEKKAKGLVAELNNGRLAQLGIMAFMAEAKVPGSVPALTGIIKPYSGECMAPFSAVDAGLPYVKEMLAAGGF
eukprot:CAMPEP_0183339170 /NCGR_PEP_ID=MMETSP0164_2-20130417/6175_1 /TAXON_ID=221442 /ORGANISM="Coccolithus pelagicus ssp braarudi, Strain PLY182g" /LENGTH=268 /DNA_ID=CAMNT_0025509127 /DNA_START=32 /DNA_END=838 /DNA_ORIENTATION=-